MGDRSGLIVDWGGVLTTDVFAAFRAFCATEGLAADAVRDRFAADPRGLELLAELECGRASEAEFEAGFAALLGVAPGGLIDRLFSAVRPDEVMLDGLRAARRAGVCTCLLSNSWGHERYDRTAWPELFDAWVISGEVGMRKPDPAIYPLAAQRLGLPPHACVYVDDLPGNLKPARALGMATVVHRDAATTLAELEELLGVPLQSRRPRP